MSVFDEYVVQSGNITYPFLLALTVCFLLTCACAVCRIWGHRARRSGLATASCPLWRRWLSQSIPTTTCESALEHCSQTRGLTSWTSRILLFHTTLHLMHASLHLCFTTARLTVVLERFSVCVTVGVCGELPVRDKTTVAMRHDEDMITYRKLRRKKTSAWNNVFQWFYCFSA